ncbi:hypothetical protein [Actinophytocola gossypii]|uniref:Uncharacterized protein n=1 Tax=Actinophytocola gossypii TaxID=2812003 RepID=A0ABT2JJ63_9PSEU|nr:hypothetical protein [Actinophytocola gossypii]MCT2587915.1 hypothetical protein [Actinophytocola gossypii]
MALAQRSGTEPLRLERVDVVALLVAFLATLVLTATVTGRVSGELAEASQPVALYVALTSLAGMLVRLGWRKLAPWVRERIRDFLLIPPND